LPSDARTGSNSVYPFLLRCNTANTSVMKSATPDKGLLDSSKITFRARLATTESRLSLMLQLSPADCLFVEVRVDQTETAYTLSKIQGGTKEEEARDEWVRAKDQLAQFYAEEQKGRADSTAASGV